MVESFTNSTYLYARDKDIQSARLSAIRYIKVNLDNFGTTPPARWM